VKVKKHKIVVVLVIIVLFIVLAISWRGSSSTIPFQSQPRIIGEDVFPRDDLSGDARLPVSSSSNQELIDLILDMKVANFSKNGFYPTFYESSLQSIYYYLCVVKGLGFLGDVNNSRLIDIIMSYYDTQQGIFMDSYSYRYLDSTVMYYYLTSVLEVNCYVVLSLEMLNGLERIDTNRMIDFIWSCYNPITSGFIGQPYDISLDSRFRISTMDNTYFAVITLDLLMGDWTSHWQQKNNIISLVSSLQFSNATPGFGGFMNDNDPSFDSIMLKEPSMLSSYYCIKTLETFGMINVIRIADFHQYLTSLKSSSENLFYFGHSYLNNYDYEYIGTALALELAELTGLAISDKNAIIDTLIAHRNARGIWDECRSYPYHDLFYTTHVIQPLVGINAIIRFNLEVKTEIFQAMDLFRTWRGFSPVSIDVPSTTLIYSIITSFEYQDRLSELALDSLYNTIQVSSYRDPYFDVSYFYSFSVNTSKKGFYSIPIEYYSYGRNVHVPDANYKVSHESTYEALESLLIMGRLGEFHAYRNLNYFIKNIKTCQVLDQSLHNRGGFLPSPNFYFYSTIDQDANIHVEQAYHAIRALEIMCNYLGKSMEDTDIDIQALLSYIQGKYLETEEIIYCLDGYTNNKNILLRDTYFMIYLLKALSSFSLDIEKIKNFVTQNIDYSNIENLYYCYKIFEILQVDIPFNFEEAHSLVKDSFESSFHEFLARDQDVIRQANLRFACEMAANDTRKIAYKIPSIVEHGHRFNISASYCNIVLDDPGVCTSMIFENTVLGAIYLDRVSSSLFRKEIMMPASPSLYPSLNGTIKALAGGLTIANVSVSINTSYSLDIIPEIATSSDHVILEIKISIGSLALPSTSRVNASIYKSDSFFKNVEMSKTNYPTFTSFKLTFYFTGENTYLFEVFLLDGYVPNPRWIGSYNSLGEVDIEYQLTSYMVLGSQGHLNVSLNNMDTLKYGTDIRVHFESMTLGTIMLEKGDFYSFSGDFFIPVVPACYPKIDAFIRVYNSTMLIAEEVVHINTYYNVSIVSSCYRVENFVRFSSICSFITGTGLLPLDSEAKAFIEVYKESILLETRLLMRQDFADKTIFGMDYGLIEKGTYHFKGILTDGFSSDIQTLFIHDTIYSDNPDDYSNPSSKSTGDNASEDDNANATDSPEPYAFDSLQVIIPILLTPGCILIFSTYYKKVLNSKLG